MVATRGTVVIADWEALPVAVASPDAVPTASALERAGWRTVRAAEGALPDALEATPDTKSVNDREIVFSKEAYPGRGRQRN